jgi:hypothetical protein
MYTTYGGFIAIRATLGGSKSVRQTDRPAPVGLTNQRMPRRDQTRSQRVDFKVSSKVSGTIGYFNVFWKGYRQLLQLFCQPCTSATVAVRAGPPLSSRNPCLGVTVNGYLRPCKNVLHASMDAAPLAAIGQRNVQCLTVELVLKLAGPIQNLLQYPSPLHLRYPECPAPRAPA